MSLRCGAGRDLGVSTSVDRDVGRNSHWVGVPQDDGGRGLIRGIAYGIIPAALLWALLIWGIIRLVG